MTHDYLGGVVRISTSSPLTALYYCDGESARVFISSRLTGCEIPVGTLNHTESQVACKLLLFNSCTYCRGRFCVDVIEMLGAG